MVRRFASRLSRTVAVALGILLVLFWLVRLPGSGLALSDFGVNGNLPLEERRELVRQYRVLNGLDEPLPAAFLEWLGRVAHFDFGRSTIDQRPVIDKLAEALPATLWLQGLALLSIYLFAIPLGVALARCRRGAIDRLTGAGLFALYSVPGFWLATLLLLGLATDLGFRLFPLERLRQAGPAGTSSGLIDLLWHSTLPVLALSAHGFAVVTLHMRAGMIDALAQDHIKTLRATGIPEGRLVWKYALRHALPPVATLFGATLPGLVSGSVVVENIFNIAGVGRLLWNATFERDYPVLQALFLLTTIAVLLGYVLSDVLLALIDPRTRTT